MNLFCKIGLSVLAGAAVLFGINCVENKNATSSVKDNETSSPITEDEDVSITSSPDEKIGEKKSDFMKSAKKTQVTVETISKIITCLYRVFECINDIFFINRYNRYSSFHQSTIII